MVLTADEWRKEYEEGARAKASKLVRKFSKSRPIIAAAISAGAEESFKAKVTSDFALKKRKAKLSALTDEFLRSQMNQFGAASYTQGVSRAALRASRNVSEGLAAIDAARATLPPKTGVLETDVTNRVLGIARAVQDAYKRKYGAS